MATYCTADDVRAALTPNGSAVDDEQTAAVLPDWQLLDAVDEAESVINSYTQDYSIVAEVHEVDDPDNPGNTAVFAAAPDPIRRWTRDIAAYLATLTFRRNMDLPEADPIRLRYTQVMEMLNDVRAGTNVLNLPPAAGTTGDKVAIFNLYEGQLFGPRDFLLAPGQQNVQVLIPGTSEWGFYRGYA